MLPHSTTHGGYPYSLADRTTVVGGRPNHTHWYGFIKQQEKGRNVAQCLKCKQLVRNTAAVRMQAHRKKCRIERKDHMMIEDGYNELLLRQTKQEDCTDVVESEMQFQDYDPLNFSSHSSSSIYSVAASPHNQAAAIATNSELPEKSNAIRSSNSDINSPSSNQDTSKLDLLAAKFFYACNVPLPAAHSRYFKEFCHEMLPSYKPPSRRRLLGPLLDKLYEEQLKVSGKYLQKESGYVLLVEGWKDSVSHTKHIATSLHSFDNRIFLQSYDISHERETREALQKIIKQAITIAKDRYDLNVFAMVADTYPVVLNASIILSTCNVYAANLLLKDILRKYDSDPILSDSNTMEFFRKRTEKLSFGQFRYSDTAMAEDYGNSSSVVGDVLKIYKEFKKENLEKNLMRLGGTKPKLPWLTESDCLSWFIANASIMQNVTGEIDKGISELLCNDSFIQSAKQLLDLLNPVAELLSNCQNPAYCLADAVEAWLHLFARATPKLLKLANIRCELHNVFNKYSLTANILHPQYRGYKLSKEHILMAEDFMLANLEEDALISYTDYKENIGFFAVLSRKTSNPKLFWNLAMNRHKALATVALQLLMIPASTTNLEQIYSNWSHIHRDLRNQLTADQVKMLMDVHFMLHVNEKKDLYEDLENTDVTNEVGYEGEGGEVSQDLDGQTLDDEDV